MNITNETSSHDLVSDNEYYEIKILVREVRLSTNIKSCITIYASYPLNLRLCVICFVLSMKLESNLILF